MLLKRRTMLDGGMIPLGKLAFVTSEGLLMLFDLLDNSV